MLHLRLSHISDDLKLGPMTNNRHVAVLGLGRLGTAIADRLRDHHQVQTWSRSHGGTPLKAVSGADVVLLCLYDFGACHDVLLACLSGIAPGATVVNTSTVGLGEAADLEATVVRCGAAYLHAPVIGSTPAVAAGRLTVLAGGRPSPDVEEVLAPLGQTMVVTDTAEAAALKLIANGVLGDSVASLGRSLRRAEALGLPRDAVLDVLARTALGAMVEGNRQLLGSVHSSGDPGPVGRAAVGSATFSAGALAKDLDLLAIATGTTSEARAVTATLLDSGTVAYEQDIAQLAAGRPDESWLHDARLDVSPELVADPAALRPLRAYALTHATGDPKHLNEAFLATAHIEGQRDGVLVSWDLATYANLFPGRPAADEATRSRRIERLDVRGSVATAIMTLRHGTDSFTDVFVLIRDAAGRWQIANKAYERCRATEAASVRL
jgi:3-hydroxyisobutyrate dehydrogenase